MTIRLANYGDPRIREQLYISFKSSYDEPWLSTQDDTFKEWAKVRNQKILDKFGPKAEHVSIKGFYHFRILSSDKRSYTLEGKKELEEIWGERFLEHYRILMTDHESYPDELYCECCDPGFPILNGENDHLLKVKSVVIDAGFLMDNRHLYEQFRAMRTAFYREFDREHPNFGFGEAFSSVSLTPTKMVLELK